MPECEPLSSLGNLPDPPNPPDVSGSMSLTATPRFSPPPSPHLALLRRPSDLFLRISSSPLRSTLPVLSAFLLHLFQVCSYLPSCASLIHFEINGKWATLILESPDMLPTLPIDSVLIVPVRFLTIICSLIPSLTLVVDILNSFLPDLWQFCVNFLDMSNPFVILVNYSLMDMSNPFVISLPKFLLSLSGVIEGSWS